MLSRSASINTHIHTHTNKQTNKQTNTHTHPHSIPLGGDYNPNCCVTFCALDSTDDNKLFENPAGRGQANDVVPVNSGKFTVTNNTLTLASTLYMIGMFCFACPVNPQSVNKLFNAVKLESCASSYTNVNGK